MLDKYDPFDECLDIELLQDLGPTLPGVLEYKRPLTVETYFLQKYIDVVSDEVQEIKRQSLRG